jgi:hypothetical protein
VAAKGRAMSESDRHAEPHVSGQELRAALAPRGGRSRASPLVAPPAAPDANEVDELRKALRRLAAAPLWRRRRVVAELAGRGLL